MKKIILSIIILTLFASVLTGCAGSSSSKETSEASVSSASSTALAESSSGSEIKKNTVNEEDVVMRVGSLKGATTMGIINMMYDDSLGDYTDKTSFTMVTAADELVTAVVKKEVDIALVPANVAAILYKKTEQGIRVIDINTLGLLYVLDRDGAVKSLADLEGKTLYMTGKGTTPDYVLQYLLNKNGVDISKVDIQFCSEAAEVLSQMDQNKDAVCVLPQPFATNAVKSDDSLEYALDLTEEWTKVGGDSKMVTAVTIVRKEFMDSDPKAVEAFMKAHKASVDFAATNDENLKLTASRIEDAGIVKAAVVNSAYKLCHITYIDGTEMQKALSGYIQALLDMDSSTVGGSLPDNGFYYINE